MELYRGKRTMKLIKRRPRRRSGFREGCFGKQEMQAEAFCSGLSVGVLVICACMSSAKNAGTGG